MAFRLSILILLAFWAFAFQSCKKEPTSPSNELPVLAQEDFDKVLTRLVDHNTVRVSHEKGTQLKSPSVVRLEIGIVDSGTFTPVVLAQSVYDSRLQVYFLSFDFTLKLDSSKTEVTLTTRYYLADSSFSDVNNQVLLYKYPYESAEIFVTTSIWNGWCCFQDVDRMGNLLFFHPTASYGLFVHDLSSGQTTELLRLVGGDAIAADSIFVFCDNQHYMLDRFNLLTNSVDLTFSLDRSRELIAGLETYEGFLYLLTQTGLIKKYSYDGALLDSIPYPRFTYFITIHDSILYSIKWTAGTDSLTRFDLRTRQFLPDLPAPSWGGEGIRIYENNLYYCDFDRRMIGIVPLADLTSPTSGRGRLAHVTGR